MTDAIYFRCLECRSERIKIAGKLPFKDDDLVVCQNCGAGTTYGNFKKANIERVTKGLKEGDEPDPKGLH